jgi:colicin import membrane protein
VAVSQAAGAPQFLIVFGFILLEAVKQGIQRLWHIRPNGGTSMNRHYASGIAVAALISLLPVCAYPAETGRSNQADGSPAVAADEMDLGAVGERIRQTGAQIRADLRKARARLDAKKAQEEAGRKREAELARQQAIKEKQRQAQEAAQARARQEKEARAAQAERERRLALAAQPTKEQLEARRLEEAKKRAADALRNARESAGAKAFE